MNIEVYKPSDETIPTKLRLKVDGKHVYYKRCSDCFAYDFELFDIGSIEQAQNIVTEIAGIMENQSYDHGQSWRITTIEVVENTIARNKSAIIRVHFRIRDSY